MKHDHLTGNTGRPASRATYPEASGGPPSNASLFGLAPGGVYHALPVTRQAVSSYLAISPLPVGNKPTGGIFSVALSPGYPAFALRTTAPCGVRTFLPGAPGAIMCPPLKRADSTGQWSLFCRSALSHCRILRIFIKGEVVQVLVYACIGKAIGHAVAGAGHMLNRPVRKTFEQAAGFLVERLQLLMFDLVAAL